MSIPCLSPLDLLATGLNDGDNGHFGGFRNLVHNGNFQINQRGYVSNTATAAGFFVHDRWKSGTANSRYTFTQLERGQVITIAAGTLQQVVDMSMRPGGDIIISWTGNAQGRVNSGSYQASPIIFSATAGTNFTIEFGTGSLWKVQAEYGRVATPFEYRGPFELLICQRYYWQWSSAANAYTFLGMHVARGAAVGAIQIPLFVPMRTAPTPSFSGNFKTFDDNVPVTLSTLTTFYHQGFVYLGTTGTFTIGKTMPCFSDNSTFCAVRLSADL